MELILNIMFSDGGNDCISKVTTYCSDVISPRGVQVAAEERILIERMLFNVSYAVKSSNLLRILCEMEGREKIIGSLN